jgi:pimeloyl-ACP methyl ester carboxylesterase
LFIHGALAGYEQGLVVGRPLAEAGYQVISVSRPGYLRTPAIEDMSFAGQADFLAALLDALKIKQAIVLGMSAGGPPAVELAARHPDRTRALLMFCAISKRAFDDPENETTTRWIFGNLMHNDFLTWLGVQSVIKALPLAALSEPGGWRARIMESPKRRARYENLLWALFPSSPRLAGALSDRSQIQSLGDLPLKKVAAPTLVMHGTEDDLVPFSHGENSAKKIAGARFVPISGADHGFMVSHDDVTWPETLGFLQRPAMAARKPAAAKPAAKPAAKKPAARKPAAKKAEPEPKPAARRSTRRTPAARPAGSPAPRRRRSTTEG